MPTTIPPMAALLSRNEVVLEDMFEDTADGYDAADIFVLVGDGSKEVADVGETGDGGMDPTTVGEMSEVVFRKGDAALVGQVVNWESFKMLDIVASLWASTA